MIFFKGPKEGMLLVPVSYYQNAWSGPRNVINLRTEARRHVAGFRDQGSGNRRRKGKGQRRKILPTQGKTEVLRPSYSSSSSSPNSRSSDGL